MVFTDTKLHPKIIKLPFWNFHWGQYVSVSHLDSLNMLGYTVAEMKWISFKLPYDLARLLCIFWFFEWKMIKIF